MFIDIFTVCLMFEPFVVVVDGDREHLLGMVLTDDVVVEDFTDLLRGRNTVARLRQRGLVLLADDVRTQLDALGANEDGRPGNEFAHLALAFAAERAVERVLGIAVANLAHFRAPTKRRVSAVATPQTQPGFPFD
jgi:hypothetical protein